MRRWAHFEWGMYVAVVLFAALVPVATFLIGPSYRPFYLNDASIWGAVKDETVPFLPCAFFVSVCLLAPFVFELIAVQFAIVSQPRDADARKKREYGSVDLRPAKEGEGGGGEGGDDGIEPLAGLLSATRLFLAGVCSTVLCLSLALLFKNYIAWPRPDEIHRCLGTDFALPPSTYSNRVITDPEGECQSSELAPNFSLQSFPSGHSASSLCSALFLSMYLVWRSYVLGKGKTVWWKILSHFLHFLAIITIVVSLWIGVSRIYDNRHHPWDVVAGWMIGFVSFSTISVPTAFSVHADYFANTPLFPS